MDRRGFLLPFRLTTVRQTAVACGTRERHWPGNNMAADILATLCEQVNRARGYSAYETTTRTRTHIHVIYNIHTTTIYQMRV